MATVTHYAPSRLSCPACHAECKRHSVYLRKLRDIGVDGPTILEVRVGNYWCATCRKFFKPEVTFAPKGKRYTARAIRKATVAIQEDKTTFTGLPNRLARDFSIAPSKSRGWYWFQDFAGQIDIEEYLRWACSRFSGQISVDSVADGDMQMWFATDPLNKDLILGYYRDKHANAESLTAFLTTLRDKYGLQPLLFTCDDANVFDSTPAKVWPNVPLQLCHFHVIKNLNYTHLRHSLRERILRYKPQKPAKPLPPDGRPLPKRSRGYMTAEYVQAREAYEAEVKLWTELHRKRRLFFKSIRSLWEVQSMLLKEAAYIGEAGKRYPAVGQFRAFILDFYGVLDAKDAATAELLRRAFLKKWEEEAKADKAIRYVLGMFADDKWFAKLFPFAAFENAHRTTNSTERANRWFRKRQKSHYRIRTEPSIRNMLNADLVYRRGRGNQQPPPIRLSLRRHCEQKRA